MGVNIEKSLICHTSQELDQLRAGVWGYQLMKNSGRLMLGIVEIDIWLTPKPVHCGLAQWDLDVEAGSSCG